MQQHHRGVWQRIEKTAGLVAIVALVVALVQLWQSKIASDSQDIAQSTQIALLQQQLDVQNQIATLQAVSSGAGPTSTIIAQRIIELESTQVALSTQEARLKQMPISDLSFSVPANIEWVNTELAINKGETVDIKYVSGQWQGAPGDYWGDGTDCSGSFSTGLVPNASGVALVARVGNGVARCVGNSPFVSANSGALYLSYNDCPGSGCFSDNKGKIIVRIKIFR